MNCEVALFSFFNFKINGIASFPTTASNNISRFHHFCDHQSVSNTLGPIQPNITPRRKEAARIAFARRGMCSFDTKVNIATSLGYSSLIIINSDDSTFPMGSSIEAFKSKIPVVMVSNAAEEWLETIFTKLLNSDNTNNGSTKEECPNSINCTSDSQFINVTISLSYG